MNSYMFKHLIEANRPTVMLDNLIVLSSCYCNRSLRGKYQDPFLLNRNMADQSWQMTNYQHISVRPCFSQKFEKIMCNTFYKYLTKNNILYFKEFYC